MAHVIDTDHEVSTQVNASDSAGAEDNNEFPVTLIFVGVGLAARGLFSEGSSCLPCSAAPRKQGQWPDIRAALIRMADYLADSDVPIDYKRRRHLDYGMLLPDKVWSQICRDTATPGPRSVRARIARCFLFERLSGQSASTSPWALDDSAFRTKTADFPRHLTPELAQALDEHPHEFLADQGIHDLHRVMAVDGIRSRESR